MIWFSSRVRHQESQGKLDDPQLKSARTPFTVLRAFRMEGLYGGVRVTWTLHSSAKKSLPGDFWPGATGQARCTSSVGSSDVSCGGDSKG